MKMKITLHGVAYEVEVELLDEVEGYGTLSGIPSRAAAGAAAAAAANAGGKTIISPVGGTIVEVKAKNGDNVKVGQELLILEAMKMQTSINSPVDGVIKSINVSAGDTVRESQVLVEFQ